MIVSKVVEGKEEAAAKFRDYFAYQEKLETSHRALALFRGRKEELLRVSLKLPEQLQAEESASAEVPFNARKQIVAAVSRSATVNGRRMSGSCRRRAGPGARSSRGSSRRSS